MSKADNYECYLLKSLIEDLNATTLPKPYEKEIEDMTLDIESPKTSTSSRHKERFVDSKSNFGDSSQTMLFIRRRITREDIVLAISDQKAALSLQSRIREIASEEIGQVIEEMRGSFAQLMLNKNGNYLCSDIFKVCSSNQRLGVLKEIYGSFKLIAINEYGTHPIQTLIEQAKTQDEINVIVEAVSSGHNMIHLAQNPYGSYVLQKIISNIPEHSRNSFNVIFLNFVTFFAVNIHGVYIAKKFICVCKSKEIISDILRRVMLDFFIIAENKFGNYFIQSLLELWSHRKELCVFKKYLSQYFVRLSKNQFGSHIAEAFVGILSMEEKNLVLQSLMQNGWYYNLLNDKYGMFVINKLVNSFLKRRE